jgi:tetratricopeptide (TPR) repeat protein
MRARTYAFGLGLFFAVGLSSAPALAQGAPDEYPACAKAPTPEEEKAGHERYIAGKADYDEANYDSAITRFKDAYKKDCNKHELLIIISRAYEQKGDRDAAVRALDEYLKRTPANAGDRSTFEQRRNKLKELADKEKKDKAAAAAAAAGNANGAGAPAEKATGGHTVYPWIVVGVGGAAIVAGAILLVAAPELPPNCDKATNECSLKDSAGNPVSNPTQTQKDKLAEDQDTAGKSVGMTTGGLIALIAGGGLVAGGLIWHFVEPTVTTGHNKSPKLTPAVAPGYAGLSLGGSF